MKKITFLFTLCLLLNVGALKAQCAGFAVSVTATDISCNGGCDGSISALPSGGTVPYTYSWSGGAIGSTATSLCAGTYTVTVTDFNGCTATATVTVTEPTAILPVITTTDATCGNFNGSASATVTGGVPPYTFIWSTIPATTSTVSNLSSGNYNLTVTDANGCTVVESFTILDTALISYTYVDTNGRIDFTSIGGRSGATYSWDFGDSTFSSLANPSHSYAQTGSYVVCVTVTDSNRVACTYCDTVVASSTSPPCMASFTFTIDTNKTATFTNTSSPLSGSTSTWNFGDGDTTTGTNVSHTYAAVGTYIVTLTMLDSNNNSCSFSDTVVVSLNTNPSRCNASYTVSLDTTKSFSVLLTNMSTNLASHNYFWDFDDSSTSTLRNPTHQFSTFGYYNVCLTITDSLLNCTSTFCDTVGMDSLGNLKSGGFGIVVEDPVIVGIEEAMEFGIRELSIYPNPASSVISVDMTDLDKPLNITLLDLSGKVVFERNQSPQGKVNTFEISGLNNGFYFMLLDDGNSRRVQKIIKSE